MKWFKQHLLLLLVLTGGTLAAQGNNEPEMGGLFYSEGKVYIVVAVLSIVLVGIFVYLFTMDRKLKRLEEQLKNK